ncbi:MAG: hypothetical protein ABIJ45_12370 [Candidatus Zixiibacteriota bacterium]
MAQLAEIEDRINKCNKILGENPNSQIFAALAEAYRKKGDLDKAFRVCQTGLKIHPEYGSAHLVMAKINLDKGLYDWAQMEIDKVIELDGNSHATDLIAAEIFIYKGEFAKATSLLNKLHVADSMNQNVIKLLELAKKLPNQAPEKSSSQKKAGVAVLSTPEILVTEHAPIDVSDSVAAASNNPRKASISLSEFIDAIADIPCIEGVLLIDRQGMVAEKRWNLDRSPDEYGAFAREMEKAIQEQVELVNFGQYESVLLEARDMVITLLPIEDYLLLIRGSSKVNLGSMNLKLNAYLKKLDMSL